MILSILIPTYNREEFLGKNILQLTDIIVKGGFQNDVKLIISDNCSQDSTPQILSELAVSARVKLETYRQSKNIGLKANALFVLEKSDTAYVMYLGDDDFITYEYLAECMTYLRSEPGTAAIIPNFIGVTVDNKVMYNSRELVGPTLRFKPGKSTLLKCSWKAHQMSGLIFKREGLYESYLNSKVDNIYPYIYFAGMSCLRGDVYLIREHLVRVTQPVKKKDWGYGDDGLMSEIFDNYRKLPVSTWTRFRLETRIFLIQNWRLMMYRQQGSNAFLLAIYKIAFAKNSSILFSLSFPFLLLFITLKTIFNRFF